MSAKSVFIWCAAAALGLTTAAMLRPADAPVSSLAASLGTEVIVQPL